MPSCNSDDARLATYNELAELLFEARSGLIAFAWEEAALTIEKIDRYLGRPERLKGRRE